MTIKDSISYFFNFNKLKKIKLFVSDIDGVMTDGRLIFDDNGVESKFFHTQDGMGVVMALKSGIKVAVISGSNSNAIKTRFDKFNKHGFEDLILGEENKMPVILTLIGKYGLNKEELAYIGDDLIDLKVMRYVGVSFAPKDATDEARKAANIILSKKGGYGAFRLAVDMILKAKGIYDEVIKEF
ncbi:HAD hydrolase family protein [Brachyspira pulli]|uniref:KdsC family phosphatase n=1 Tax=Brachyspira pulli TaxID=310721 RepID=UPI00300610C8